LDWINMAQYRDKWQTPVNMVMNIHVPKNIDNFLTLRGISGFPQKPLLHRVTLPTIPVHILHSNDILYARPSLSFGRLQTAQNSTITCFLPSTSRIYSHFIIEF
jgi:hypothetical protein